jgi:hypothetical protein
LTFLTQWHLDSHVLYFTALASRQVSAEELQTALTSVTLHTGREEEVAAADRMKRNLTSADSEKVSGAHGSICM